MLRGTDLHTWRAQAWAVLCKHGLGTAFVSFFNFKEGFQDSAANIIKVFAVIPSSISPVPREMLVPDSTVGCSS